ncbi:hypothetical protein ALC56_09960, partial [Trachymyrmex septentrionalis]
LKSVCATTSARDTRASLIRDDELSAGAYGFILWRTVTGDVNALQASTVMKRENNFETNHTDVGFRGMYDDATPRSISLK